MRRGRPASSPIRKNISEILFSMGRGYGYDIYKVYSNIFPKVTMRSVYYHLRKGVEIGEFEIDKIEREKGDYSWGETAEKIYYRLGRNSSPKGDERIRDFLNSIKKDGE